MEIRGDFSAILDVKQRQGDVEWLHLEKEHSPANQTKVLCTCVRYAVMSLGCYDGSFHLVLH